MNGFESDEIRHQVYLEQYKNGHADRVVALLDDACAEISRFIKKTDGVHTKARYKEIARKLKVVSKSLRERVGESTDIDGIIDYELAKQKKLLKKAMPYIKKINGAGTVNLLYPTREQIKTAALFAPIADNMTYQGYLDRIENGLYGTWDSAVRTGYITGQTASQIVRSVMGGISPESRLRNPGAVSYLRNSVYRNTRTLLQSLANETRSRVFGENEKYFGGGSEFKYEYLSTLDTRTCLVCASYDGKLYRSMKDTPRIPVHISCRCIILPYFGEIEGETRAAKDGPVDAGVKYSDWLGSQPDDVQEEVLGKTRYRMYKDGTPMSQFVDNGKTLTLDQLREKAGIYTEGHVKSVDITSRKSEVYSDDSLDKNAKHNAICRWLHYEDAKTGIENMVIADFDGNILVMNSGTTGEVKFSDTKRERNAFMKASERSLTIYHNHSLNSSFSGEDIDVLIRQSRIRKSYIVCKSKLLYSLEVSAGRRFNLTDDIIKQYNNLYELFNKDSHKTTAEIARMYGLVYKSGVVE